MQASAGIERRGNVLLVMFLFLFVLMGVIALVVDMGLLQIERRRMQSAVNTAALEGLRGKGNADFDTPTRRAASKQLLELAYRPNDMPSVELNSDNEPQGDLVTGEYERFDTEHLADEDFTRSDFDDAAGDSAFLARLRRTHRNETATGVSSQGPSLPLLFGRLSLIAAGNASDNYNVRRDGITIRATAISDSRAAILVGPANAQLDPPLPGLAPLAFDVAEWNQLAPSQQYDLDIGGGDVADTMGVIAKAQIIHSQQPVAVGFPIEPLILTPAVWPEVYLPPNTSLTSYVPIVQAVNDGVTDIQMDVVVGFGSVTIRRNDMDEYIIERLHSFVAARNASATSGYAWRIAYDALSVQLMNNADYADSSLEEQQRVLSVLLHSAMTDSAVRADDAISGALLAPALVRSIR